MSMGRMIVAGLAVVLLGGCGRGAAPPSRAADSVRVSSADSTGTLPLHPTPTQWSFSAQPHAGWARPGPGLSAVIQRKLDSLKLPWRAVNAGVSGETSAGALRRLDWMLRDSPAILVVETGANDMLRGVDWTRPAPTSRRSYGEAVTPIWGDDRAGRHGGGAESRAAICGAVPRAVPRPRRAGAPGVHPFLLEGVGAWIRSTRPMASIHRGRRPDRGGQRVAGAGTVADTGHGRTSARAHGRTGARTSGGARAPGREP